MRLYAVFKDGQLFRASYKQNVPFYETELGARRALQSATNRSSLPEYLWNVSESEQQEYLDAQKARYDIREFELDEVRGIRCQSERM